MALLVALRATRRRCHEIRIAAAAIRPESTRSAPERAHAERALREAPQGLPAQAHEARGGGKPEEKLSLEELVRTSSDDVFENAAQIWNHNFYWRSMRPGGGGRPDKAMGELLAKSFGSVADFKRRLAEAATERFGSGWAWLLQEQGGRLRIESSSNADNPLRNGFIPLLVIDVWEHAYYLDYQSERDRYVKGFLDHLLNWEFVAENLAGHEA